MHKMKMRTTRISLSDNFQICELHIYRVSYNQLELDVEGH